MRIILLVAALFVLTTNVNKAIASHIPGANITYTCDPNDPLTYTFTLTLFRLCPGTHPTTMSSTYFTLTNTCGLANPIVPTFNQVGTEQDVNQLCSTATSNCSGGTSQGVWMYTYEATITLPANCDSWTIAFDLCCRDIATNMSNGASNNMYTETTMYTSSSPCNDSPVVTAQPIPYACINTPFNYCLTTSDPQGDSVYYQLITPMGIGGAPLVFNPGWSTNAPVQNFTFNPLTGCFSFNSPVTGNFIMNIQINSYDSNGNLASSVTHDFQVYILNCTNTPPTEPNGGITNFSGGGTQINNNTISACYGDNVCFDVEFEDLTDPNDVITIVQDGTTLLPGATFVQTGTNPVVGTFCWTAQPGFTGSIITFSAEDDGCPVMGTSAFAVDFNIQTGVWAGPDPIICGSQSTVLSANGASAYTWSPSTGLSCTNCPNPIANPATTTTYTLTGNLSGTCPNVDNVTVNVVPDFTPTMVPTTQTICANEIAQLNITGPGANGPYTYDWTPIATLSNPTIQNPLAQPLQTTTYTCEITSADGCVKTATTDVVISGIGPTVNIIPSDTLICPGQTVQYDIQAAVIPVVCGPAAGNCTGTSSYAQVGTATTATSTYGPFYGSSVTTTDYTTKHQYIYTAAELNALGFNGGTIKDIALFTTLTANYLYDGFTIWMGCTSIDQFASNNFEAVGSLTQVFGPTDNINPTDNGWTVFDIADWDWDGTSNLIFQFCASENNQENAVGIDYVQYSSTSPAYRCIYDLDYTLVACNQPAGTRTTLRPNMRFNMCQPPLTSPTFTWSPAGTLSATNISNPVASPTGDITYVVDVTANGCTGSGSASITINNVNNVNAAPDVEICPGDSYNLNAVFSGPLPLSSVPCGVAGGCTGANNNYIIGTQTGQNTTTSWPAPFGNFYRNAKHQFLFTAAELNAMGIQGGKINQMAFQVTTINGTTTYNSYRVSMGCTNITTLTNWESGLTQVKNPYTHNVIVGWNNIVFDTPYMWDGISNLIVEICYDNLAVTYTQNCFSPWTTTTFNSSRYFYSDGTAACPYTAGGTNSINRPLTRFTVCDPPPPVTLTYTWTPALDLNNPTLADPIATPSAPMGSTVSYVVEASGGICTVYDTVNIIICNPLPVELISFSGYANGEQNNLVWKTASEINSDYFIVQRSADGLTFEQIGIVDAAGNTQEMQEYRLTDATPLEGVNYYRLRQVDFDGSYNYSDIIALNRNIGSSIQIYPNPTTMDLFIDFNEILQEGTHTIMISDVSGKMFTQQLELNKSQKTYKIEDFAELKPGIYIVKVLNPNNEIIKLEKINKL